MKELLIILRDHIETNRHSVFSGLCYELIRLSALYHKINDIEYNKLLNYIETHRPKRGKHFDKKYKMDGFYWAPGSIEPRINWLNDKIKRFK